MREIFRGKGEGGREERKEREEGGGGRRGREVQIQQNNSFPVSRQR